MYFTIKKEEITSVLFTHQFQAHLALALWYFDFMDDSMDTWHLCTSWYNNYSTLAQWIQCLAALVTHSF